jgi:quercetin dioxygenase-like cupin family protein
MKELFENNIFGQGVENPYGKFFIGKSYLNLLNEKGVPVCNVTFEAGCRNNWHIHLADKGGGQILLCTNGEGWYQEWNKPAQRLKPGDVVYIAPGVKHWHGATANSPFVHIALEVPGENTSNEWLESVDDEHYGSLEK